MISGPFAMSFRAVLAASALFVFAAPAFAQDAPAPAPAPAAPAAPSAEEAALQAKGEAFGARMQQMATEMQSAVTAAAGDTAKANADLDVIVARYQPEADAFGDEVAAFITAQSATAPAEQQAQMAQMIPMITAEITGVPAKAKTDVLAAAASAAAPAVPQ
jgi:hypothetical protein